MFCSQFCSSYIWDAQYMMNPSWLLHEHPKSIAVCSSVPSPLPFMWHNVFSLLLKNILPKIKFLFSSLVVALLKDWTYFITDIFYWVTLSLFHREKCKAQSIALDYSLSMNSSNFRSPEDWWMKLPANNYI